MLCMHIELHQAVQQHGPLEDFKKLYSTFPNENSRMTDLGQHTLLFRYIYMYVIGYAHIAKGTNA